MSLIDRWWLDHEQPLNEEDFEVPVRKNPARFKKSLLDRTAIATRTAVLDKYGSDDVLEIPLIDTHQHVFEAGVDPHAKHDFKTPVDDEIVDRAAELFLEAANMASYIVEV